MGVPKLWEELEPAVRITSWAQLAAPTFASSGEASRRASAAPARGLRVGVDVSQWMFHMNRMTTIVDPETGESINPGPNAELRMVFYRVCDFLAHGILAVFVFDGPNRPDWKRGQQINGGWQGRQSPEVQEMLELMGMEWRIAPGEAEAELAAMSRRGEIDAVLSDDVDTLLFGATTIIRNSSKTLSGNKSKVALARQASASDVQPGSSQSGPSQPIPTAYPPVPPGSDVALVSYSSRDLEALVGLDTDGLILIALLSGADYDVKGAERFGTTISAALARAGYGRRLLDGFRALRSSSAASAFPATTQGALTRFFAEWRASVAEELRENPNKILSKRQPSLADKLETRTDFPLVKVVDYYLNPVVSDPSSASYAAPTWSDPVDLTGLVKFATRMFEWGHVEMQSKLRNKVWAGLVARELRRAALSSSTDGARIVPRGFLSAVHDLKCEKSTGFVPSYRVELCASVFDDLGRSVLPSRDAFPLPDYGALSEGEEQSERLRRRAKGWIADAPKEPSGTGAYRHWVPVELVEAHPEGRACVERWRSEKERKRRTKEAEEQRREERRRAKELGTPASSPAKKRASPSKRRVVPPSSDDEIRREIEEEQVRRARNEMLALGKAQVKGKGKAREEGGEDELPARSSGLRRTTASKKPSSAGGLLKFGTSTKPGLSSFTSSKPAATAAVRSTTPSKTPADIFLSSSPSSSAPLPTAGKRVARPPSRANDADLVLSSTDDSEEGTPARRAVQHVNKAARPSQAARSPTKKRVVGPAEKVAARAPAVLDLLSDSSFEGGGASVADISPTRSSPGLDDFLEKRRATQRRVEQQREALKAGVLVLSDSD
ncbi:hypothetical protein Rhopal_000907-T1 [Rhodotorula paludigena]|uniref:XPG-I domain-containing protein n=1 Tax=Rhodotorula paludigena TaxID=86838 RepID=A0AAV5GFT7_9BASI|nr:hypothetical protein Rhopal_000907-T1 [Rhodotorula paludigena]